MMQFIVFTLKMNSGYCGKHEKNLFSANMQIISTNIHDTKMAQAKIDSTEKTGLETTKKLLVHIFIRIVMGISLSIMLISLKYSLNSLIA